MTHNEMVAKWKEDTEFRREYDALEEELTLFDELLRARKNAGLTPEQVAERTGTKHAADRS